VSHLEVLESELRIFQIELLSHQKLVLARYCDELIRWNKKMNLTGLAGASMVRRLVVEPVWVGLHLHPAGVLADIGSGNGSPAIPLHVVSRLEKTHLIEARARRAAFLRHLGTSLALPGLIVHRGRFEDVTSSLGSVDWVTLQGVHFSTPLLDSIRQVASRTTTIVWITSSAKGALQPSETLQVPITGTQVLLFRLDQS
jgi:16S rRNA (guanine(527)-N(7))-methyltransferase RsmG